MAGFLFCRVVVRAGVGVVIWIKEIFEVAIQKKFRISWYTDGT